MLKSGVFALLGDVESDILALKWDVAAGEKVEIEVRTPMGLTAHVSPDPASPSQTIGAGTVVRFVDFFDDWALVSSDDEELGWTRHSLGDAH